MSPRRRSHERTAPRRSGSAGTPAGSRAEDPGYYLISKGRRGFEREIGYRVPLTQWLLRAYVAGATPGYLGTIGIIAGLLVLVPLVATHAAGVGPAVLVLLGLVALIPASDLAVALINRVVTELLGPRALPRLELAEGIPTALRTLVVMPTLLVSDAEIEEQVNRLELHYLANPEGAIHFALLSDWMDAPTETMPADDRLLEAAIEGIAAAQPAPWSRSRRGGPIPPAPPPPGLE